VGEMEYKMPQAVSPGGVYVSLSTNSTLCKWCIGSCIVLRRSNMSLNEKCEPKKGTPLD